jgi:hypothetical protein
LAGSFRERAGTHRRRGGADLDGGRLGPAAGDAATRQKSDRGYREGRVDSHRLNLRANWHQVPGSPGPVRIGARPLSSRRVREAGRSLGPDHSHRRRAAGPPCPRRCGSAASRPRAPSNGEPDRS